MIRGTDAKRITVVRTPKKESVPVEAPKPKEPEREKVLA